MPEVLHLEKTTISAADRTRSLEIAAILPLVLVSVRNALFPQRLPLETRISATCCGATRKSLERASFAFDAL
eukprot:562108-Amphidinium_carterae.1